MPAIVFYVSGHGFGHASRVIEVINDVIRRRPDIEVHVRTSAPRWLFELTVVGPFTFHPAEVDTGVVQIDSLHPDIPATIRRAAAFYTSFDARAEGEAAWLGGIRPRLVVADAPPLAFAGAARARVPAVAFGNFTWDWIYEGYSRWLGAAAWLPALLRQAQTTAAEAWRLPMHGGFVSYSRIVDLPFVARHSRRTALEVRRALGIEADRPAVLVSFGGFGLDGLPLDVVARSGRFTVVTTATPGERDERSVKDVPPARRTSSVVVIDERALYAAGYRYEDLVAASDVVVTKPGYGILAESIANGPAVLYTARGEFAEYEVLVREMPRYLRCRFIGHADLLSGRWDEHVERLLGQPAPPERVRTDGAAMAAERAVALVG